MKHKKLFLRLALVISFILTGFVIWWALNNEHESLIFGAYFPIWFFIVSHIWRNLPKKPEPDDTEDIRRYNKQGYYAIPLLLVSFVYILVVFFSLRDDDNIWWFLIGGGIFLVIGLIWTLDLRKQSKQSLSGQDNCIVEPEKFWRVLWNMLPARFGNEKNPILNVLIIHSAQGEHQAKQMQQRYEQAKDELWIDQHSCKGNNKNQLINKLTAINYIGVHLIYTEDIRSEMPWVKELCDEWANNNPSKPIVYTNCTDETLPFNYGISNKDSDGILRLFQRTHTLSESWREQAGIQHKSFWWIFISFIIILIGLGGLFFFNNMNNNNSIVLVGGGTVKTYLKEKIDNKKFSVDNLLFIPMPSGDGCKQLGDEGFMQQLQGNVIIMSSKQQDTSAFNLKNGTRIEHILEIPLCTEDKFYIRSNCRNINENDKDTSISLKSLEEKIKTYDSIIIYRTNVNSGTYDFYKTLIENLENMGKKTVPYDEKSSFPEKQKYIILTRTFYDPPAAVANLNTQILYIEDEKGEIEAEDLFLYIPITKYELNKHNKYIIPDKIYGFLNSLELGKFQKEIYIHLTEKIINYNKVTSQETSMMKKM